jgi:hypothetical protein
MLGCLLKYRLCFPCIIIYIFAFYCRPSLASSTSCFCCSPSSSSSSSRQKTSRSRPQLEELPTLTLRARLKQAAGPQPLGSLLLLRRKAVSPSEVRRPGSRSSLRGVGKGDGGMDGWVGGWAINEAAEAPGWRVPFDQSINHPINAQSNPTRACPLPEVLRRVQVHLAQTLPGRAVRLVVLRLHHQTARQARGRSVGSADLV